MSWIMGIAHNVAVDEVRRRNAGSRRHFEYTGEDTILNVAATDNSPGPEEMAIDGMRRRAILDELRKLPEAQRKVIEMAYFGGMTQTEIAEQTGEALGTIKTRTRLALQHLRSNIGALKVWSED